MNIFSKAMQGLNLTPGERAFLKLFEGWLFTALGAGGAVGYQLLMSGSADYALILRAAGGAALLTLLLAIKKYLAAQTDVPLPEKVAASMAVDTAISQIQQYMPQPIVFPAPVAPVQQQQVQLPFVNLTGTASPSPTPAVQFAPGMRHFGDSQLMPVVSQQPQ